MKEYKKQTGKQRGEGKQAVCLIHDAGMFLFLVSACFFSKSEIKTFLGSENGEVNFLGGIIRILFRNL